MATPLRAYVEDAFSASDADLEAGEGDASDPADAALRLMASSSLRDFASEAADSASSARRPRRCRTWT